MGIPVTVTVDDQVDVDVEPNRSSVNGDGVDDDPSTVVTEVDDPWADSDLFVAGVDSPGVSGDPESYSSRRNLMAVDSGSEAVGDSVGFYQTVDGTESRDDGVADETTTHGGACFSDEDFGLDFSGPDDGDDLGSPGASESGMSDPQVVEGDRSVLVADDFGLDFPDHEDDRVGGSSGDVETVDSLGGRGHGVSSPQVNGVEVIPPDGGHEVDSSDDGGYDHSGVDVSMGVGPAYGDYDWFDGDGGDDDDRVYSNPGAYEEDLRSAPVGPGDDGGLVLDWDPRAFDDW